MTKSTKFVANNKIFIPYPFPSYQPNEEVWYDEDLNTTVTWQTRKEKIMKSTWIARSNKSREHSVSFPTTSQFHTSVN